MQIPNPDSKYSCYLAETRTSLIRPEASLLIISFPSLSYPFLRNHSHLPLSRITKIEEIRVRTTKRRLRTRRTRTTHHTRHPIPR